MHLAPFNCARHQIMENNESSTAVFSISFRLCYTQRFRHCFRPQLNTFSVIITFTITEFVSTAVIFVNAVDTSQCVSWFIVAGSIRCPFRLIHLGYGLFFEDVL